MWKQVHQLVITIQLMDTPPTPPTVTIAQWNPNISAFDWLLAATAIDNSLLAHINLLKSQRKAAGLSIYLSNPAHPQSLSLTLLGHVQKQDACRWVWGRRRMPASAVNSLVCQLSAGRWWMHSGNILGVWAMSFSLKSFGTLVESNTATLKIKPWVYKHRWILLELFKYLLEMFSFFFFFLNPRLDISSAVFTIFGGYLVAEFP